MTEQEIRKIVAQAIHDEVYGGITMHVEDGKLRNWQQFLRAVESNASRRAAKKICEKFGDDYLIEVYR